MPEMYSQNMPPELGESRRIDIGRSYQGYGSGMLVGTFVEV